MITSPGPPPLLSCRKRYSKAQGLSRGPPGLPGGPRCKARRVRPLRNSKQSSRKRFVCMFSSSGARQVLTHPPLDLPPPTQVIKMTRVIIATVTSGISLPCWRLGASDDVPYWLAYVPWGSFGLVRDSWSFIKLGHKHTLGVLRAASDVALDRRSQNSPDRPLRHGCMQIGQIVRRQLPKFDAIIVIDLDTFVSPGCPLASGSALEANRERLCQKAYEYFRVEAGLSVLDTSPTRDV